MANDLNGIFTLKEFYNRGVVKLAPDVLVYVGGSLTTSIIAPVSSNNGNLSFNDGISSVSVQNIVDPPGSSSANIEIVTPLYGPNSKYWVLYPGPDPSDPNSNPVRAPLFIPMMEVKIYFKGRFLVNNQPKYYPAFWGFITNVDESYNGGVYKISVICADILHWWHYSTINIHPIVEANQMAGGHLPLTVWATIFNTSNPFQIIYNLMSLMGWTNFVSPTWVGQMTPPESIFPVNPYDQANGIMAYWSQRFANQANLLKMYGINGQQVDKNGVQMRNPEISRMSTGQNSLIGQAANPKDALLFTLNLNYLNEFVVLGDFSHMAQFASAEYMTKLDIATNVKTRCGYEFFQDVNGNFIFKPPFYNMNVKGMLPYTLLPSDIISYSINQESEGIVTNMTVNTPFGQYLKYTTFGLGKGFFQDINLTKQYGVRPQEMHMEYIQDPAMARAFAVGQMALINSKTVAGTVVIPGRPEMRLGYPVYIEHRDSFHYVKSISHSFDYGGTFVTTLNLEIERKKVYDSDNLFNSPAGKGVPYIDTVLRLDPSIPPPSPNGPTSDPNSIYQIDPNTVEKQTLLRAENRIVSSDPGGYVVSPRGGEGKVTSSSYGPRQAQQMDLDRAVQELSTTATTVPYTDEDGYQLIGAFPYGRELNPVLVSSETAGPPTFKDVNLLTMPRPLYQSESDAMSVLFFDNEEGAVPAYLNTGKQTPRTLGAVVSTSLSEIYNMNNVLTANQQVESNVSQVSAVTPVATKILTSPGVSVPPGAAYPALTLDQLSYQKTNFATPSTTRVDTPLLYAPPVTAITPGH
jgi:hypothetical protein